MNVIEEIKLVEAYQKLKSYKNGYRNFPRITVAFVGDIILAVVGEDSFVIGEVIENKQFYKVKILHQLGETYHNGKDNTIYVNDFELYEILN